MKDKETPRPCVCGAAPCSVKYKGKRMISCPNTLVCGLRGAWKKTEDEAVSSWNIEIQRARKEKK